MLWTFSLSVQGESHKKKEIENPGRLFPCQDNSDDDVYKKTQDFPAAVVSVADGHGSPAYFRSRTGSKRAIVLGNYALKMLSEEVIKHYLSDKNVVKEEFLKMCMKGLTNAWKVGIEKDLQRNPITEEEIEYLKKEDIQALQKYLNAIEEHNYEELGNK